MEKLFISENIFLNNEFVNGGIVVSSNGKIQEILPTPVEVAAWKQLKYNETKDFEFFDFSKLVLMCGLIDSHVHINEPGRTEWEGFETATRAACYGGFTTIVDMPLNSIPPTTTVDNLKIKQKSAQGNIFVDVAFWGGIIPGNQDDLEPLLGEGVVGFKCFLCPSGVQEFPHVERPDIELAFEKLQYTSGLIAFHAEVCPKGERPATPTDDSHRYNTYLQTRPPKLELDAIELVTDLSLKYKTVRTHIVHLSSAEAIPLIQNCRKQIGDRLTVETCHHYLTLAAEDVPDQHVEFKCCPPVRGRGNQEKLWQAIINKDINLVVSDHSPSTPDMKLLCPGENHGDFLKAWGGISSVQFGLSLFWTNCQKYGLNIADIQNLMCAAPAKLCSIDGFKGKIDVGYDADFCIWNPGEEFIVTSDIVQFRNKANPYMGQKLKGKVYATVVRGNLVHSLTEEIRLNAVGTLLKSNSIS